MGSQPAAVDEGDLARDARIKLGRGARDDDRDARAELIEDVPPCGRIDGAQRLVEEEDLRVADERGGERDVCRSACDRRRNGRSISMVAGAPARASARPIEVVRSTRS